MTVGIFDSGVGGLSVLFPLLELVPDADYIYFADQAHCPYGSLPEPEIRQRAFAITDYLLNEGATLIVVACNTASAAGLSALRHRHPNTPFVGMEPAVKPAAQHTRTGQIGVLATATTAHSERLATLIDRFGHNITVHVHVPEGLVQLVESGAGESDQSVALLAPTLHDWFARGVDTIVLGCTHYPFARRAIAHLAGPNTHLIDPSPAVARRAATLLTELGSGGAHRPPEGAPPNVTFLTTGNPLTFHQTLSHLAPTIPTPHITHVDI